MTHIFMKVWCYITDHDYTNLCPPGTTPFVVCKRCEHSGWLLP